MGHSYIMEYQKKKSGCALYYGMEGVYKYGQC